MSEAARVQLNLSSSLAQRAAQGMVIRRRVRRGIDYVNAHGKDNRCACGDNGLMTPDEPAATRPRSANEIELSYCVVNTSQRELLLRGLDAIARERKTVPFAG